MLTAVSALDLKSGAGLTVTFDDDLIMPLLKEAGEDYVGWGGWFENSNAHDLWFRYGYLQKEEKPGTYLNTYLIQIKNKDEKFFKFAYSYPGHWMLITPSCQTFVLTPGQKETCIFQYE